MVKYKIIFDRANCIGAGACAAMDSEHFKMVGDGKADLIGGKDIGDGKWELEVEGNSNIIEAAKACPVVVIKVKDESTGEYLVK
jgi:ferredoxin